MFNLLSWLYDQAGKVYAFFGWLYDRIKDAAINAYNWARTAASDAYNWALERIHFYYDLAKAKISQVLVDAKNFALFYIDLAIKTLNDWVNWLKGEIDYWYDRARTGAQAIVNGVIDLAYWLFNQAVQGAQGLVDGLFLLLTATFDRTVYEINQSIADTKKSIEDFKAAFNANNPEAMDNIVTLFSNPIGWVFAVLQDRFTEFLCYQLAQGLGTVKYDLPPSPSFGMGAGGSYPNGDPPSGSGILKPPLSYLRISGYTFNNPPGHMGIDFGLADGDPVFAMHNGAVLTAGWSSVGYGFQIVIQGGDWWSRYAHCKAVNVMVGQTVLAGQILGLGDNTGNSSGNHLHLEIKRLGRPIDPLTVL